MKDPIAIVCSDLHLTLKQPACRDDKDWMLVQQYYLEQVTELSFLEAENCHQDMRGKYLPVIIAGDIFDKWNPSPELLTFAFKYLPPRVYAIPGQHDLPNHRVDDMHKSGYGVLVEAERITNLSRLVDHPYQRYALHGFGWNQKIMTPDPSFKKLDLLHIAVVHKFIWMENYGYPGAPSNHHKDAIAKTLTGYKVAIFGDNHKGFETKVGPTTICNCGGFIRRKTDEMDYAPRVGVLYNNGTIKYHYLDTSCDRFHKDGLAREKKAEEFDMRDFLENLDGLGEHGMDFKEAVRQALREKSVPKGVESLILAALDQ